MNSIQDDYFLLYSTLGYESGATKRAFVRTKKYIDPASIDCDESEWQLFDENGKGVLHAPLKWLGVTYAIQLWEIDFSKLQRPGFYKLSVTIRGKSGEIIGSLASQPFEISRKLFFKRTFRNVSIINSEARMASEVWGSGYFDCNSQMGEAYSHGIFLAGLSHAYSRRSGDLSSDDRKRLIKVVNVTADYLMDLHVDNTGELAHEHKSRPGQHANTGVQNTQEGLYGLATYAHLFKDVEPDGAEKAFKIGVKSIEYLKKSNSFPAVLAASVYYHMYKYTGNKADKDSAISSLNNQLSDFQLRSAHRSCWRAIPFFEGLYFCATEFTDHLDYNDWIQAAKCINEDSYQYVLNNNGFRVVPTAGADWDHMESMPKGEARHKWYANTHFLATVLDTIYLAQITGDRSLEKIASGALGWVTGLNPGVPKNMVANPPSEQSRAAAAFIMNLDARHAEPWSHWFWSPQPDSMMSVENGFLIQANDWAYVDDWPSAESFIKHDGVYLYAISVYEDYLGGVL